MKESYEDLSNTEESFLNVARAVAKTSTCRMKHGAVVVSGGRVLATGINSDKNNPFVFEHSYQRKTLSSVHAEMAAIRMLYHYVPVRATMYVARVNNQGIDRMSRPCNNCWKELQNFHIKEVIYTIEVSLDTEYA